MILPIKNSLLYIEPLYLRASGENSIPEMKKVIVSYGDKIDYQKVLTRAWMKFLICDYEKIPKYKY